MRAFYRFGKTRRLMYVSHLDLQRFMQMALRRTDLPVAYSQGFNPHPVMNFASALAMGWTSEAELLDIKFTGDVTREHAFDAMQRALPIDLPLYEVRLVPDDFPKGMARLRMADYRITLIGDTAGAIVGAIPEYMAKDSCIAIRKTKTSEKPTDIRPWSVSMSYKQTDVGHEIDCRLKLTEAETLKPDLLLTALADIAGCALPEIVRIHRLTLLGVNDAGEIVDLIRIKARSAPL